MAGKYFIVHLVPAGNSPQAVAADTEMFKKQSEPVASAWGRGWAADGCVHLPSPGYTSAEELAWGDHPGTHQIFGHILNMTAKKWARLDYFNMYTESNGPVIMSGR